MNPGESPLGYTPRTEPLGAPAAPVPPTISLQPQTYGTLPTEPVVPTAPRHRRRGLLIALIAVAAIVVVGGGATAWALQPSRHPTPAGAPTFHSIFEQPGEPFTVNGTFTITGGCSGRGYSDIQAGTQVVITDESGKTIAVGELVADGFCEWKFTIKNVPPGHQFYGVTVSHRGTIQYTETELRNGVGLSLGG